MMVPMMLSQRNKRNEKGSETEAVQQSRTRWVGRGGQLLEQRHE